MERFTIMTVFAGLLVVSTAQAHGGHGSSGGGHGGGHMGGAHFGSVHFNSGIHTGYGSGHYYGGYHGYWGVGVRPWWRGPYWPYAWPYYLDDAWPFYVGRAFYGAGIAVNNAVLMAPLEPRYYYYHEDDSHDAASAATLVSLARLEPVFSGAGKAQYTVHRELRDPPLTIGTLSFPEGYATSIPASLRFALDGTYANFHVQLGVSKRAECADSADANPAAVVFSIVADGNVLYTSQPLTVSTATGDSSDQNGEGVQAPIPGVRTLELRTEGLGDCAWAVWGEPEITRH